MSKNDQPAKFNFEVFQSRRKPIREEPTLSLQFDDRLIINNPAYTLMESPEAVVVLYDRQRNVIGLRAVEMDSPSSYRVKPASPTSSTYVVNCRAALRHFGVPTQRSVFNAVMAEGILVADLNNPLVCIMASSKADTDNN